MDSIVKIVLALKLKFLLIILSIGTSYLIEHRMKKQTDPISAVEIISPDTLRGSGNVDARSLFHNVDEDNDPRLGSGDYLPLQPINYVASRPIWYQGLEIYIVL